MLPGDPILEIAQKWNWGKSLGWKPGDLGSRNSSVSHSLQTLGVEVIAHLQGLLKVSWANLQGWNGYFLAPRVTLPSALHTAGQGRQQEGSREQDWEDHLQVIASAYAHALGAMTGLPTKET